jgi:hypothetical protein
MEKLYHKLFKSTLSTILTVIISCLAVIGFAYASTTISANIVTGGTLTVSSLSTFSTATTTSATSTAYLYVGSDFTEDANMDFSGDLFVSNDVNVAGVTYLDGALQATSTLLVTDAAILYSTLNVTGLTTMTRATSSSATTTDYLYVGADGTETPGWDFSGGDLFVTGAAYFNTKATSSAALVAGSGTGDNIDFGGGDLYVQDDAEIDGSLYLSNTLTLQGGETIGNVTNNNIFLNATGVSMATTTATTTPGIWVAAPAGNTTSTVVIGHGGATYGELEGCLELWKDGNPYKIYIDVDATDIKVAEGRCKD